MLFKIGALLEILGMLRSIRQRGDETDQSLCEQIQTLIIELHSLSVDPLAQSNSTMNSLQ